MSEKTMRPLREEELATLKRLFEMFQRDMDEAPDDYVGRSDDPDYVFEHVYEHEDTLAIAKVYLDEGEISENTYKAIEMGDLSRQADYFYRMCMRGCGIDVEEPTEEQMLEYEKQFEYKKD